MKFRSFCLVGDNVSHSKSHIIHRELMCAYGTGGSYDLVSVQPADFDWKLVKIKNHYDGFNITKPYKEMVYSRLDDVKGAAWICRSVNTVKMENDGSATGYSTDGVGFLRALSTAGVNPEDKSVLIIGNGGAAKAIAHALAAYKCRIYVYARNNVKARQFVELFEGRVGYMDTTLKNKYDIIINCTPVGQFPNINESPLPRAYLDGASFIFDTVYNPPETVLMSYAREMGIKCAGGMDMLIYQAYEAQRIWQNADLTEDALCATIKKIKEIVK